MIVRVIPLISRFAALAAAALISFWAAMPATAQVRISEFMAANVSVLQDEDGDYSDWIEIYNAGGTPVDLAGWHLTDTPTNLVRWTFPATPLAAGGFLVVFASGKDRTSPRLHANFSLSNEGEYLALVRPDGTTLEHAYAPAYPGQFPDISYGLQTHGANPTLRAGQPGYLIYRTPGSTNTCLPGPHPLYSPDSAARVDLTISQTDWDWLMNSPWDESFRSVDIRFRHGDIDLAVTNVGIQCRGNTSREKQPRSFNVVFNAFVPGQRLLDMERLNLNSDANDPSFARPKLAHDLSAALDLQAPHGNHVGLVVSNSTYHYAFFDALRNNSQPVDDSFLKQRFGTDRGNLYKCTIRDYSPTLEYRGPDGSSYVGAVYALGHAGSGDSSCQDLADFVTTITQTSDTDFPNAILQAFDVDGFLRRMALDVLSGHWDNYWVNANNYYLYFRPETRRWEFIPYDFDNAFGINWIGSDWAYQNVYDWKNLGNARPNTPLANRLFAVPEFSNRYSFYMKQMLDTVFTSARIDPAVFHTRSTLTNAVPFAPGAVTNMLALERQRYDGDWPWWSYNQRFWSYNDAQWPYNGNVPNQYGLTNFIGARRASALAQLHLQNISPILSDFSMTPSLPRSNDAIAVSIRAVDDVAVTNVSFHYAFNGGATNVLEMPLQTDGSFATNLPAFGATGTVRYFVRAHDNTGKATFHPYGGPNYAATVEIGSAAFDLVVSEINYNPYALTDAEINAGVTDAQDLEFVELYNAGNAPMDITSFKLQDGVTATFPSFILTHGLYAVIVKNTNAFRLRYTNSAIRIIGVFGGNLSNGGETLRLENASGGVIASLAYGDSGDWPGRADGDGSSLELIDPANPAYADPSAWRSSSEYGGSPGGAGLGPDNRIVINEVLTHTDPPLSDTIELFNTTEGAIDIGGWCLSDAKSNYRKYAIPASTVLPAGGYIAFNETNHFNTSGGLNTNDFSLDGAHGDDVYLLETDARTNLARFADHVDFGAAANGESFGRWPNGTGRLYPMASRTFGSANSGPRVGPLVIGELMYNPPSGSNHLEFIEIANPTALPVDLTRWQLDRGIAFAFSTGTVIAAGGALVILSFDPTAVSNSALLASFRATYGISTNVPLLGPYSGALSDGGERVRLLRPDEPPAEEPDFVPMLIEDEVNYDDNLPWPVEADAGGASLARIMPAAWGDSFTSWIAANPPTPGENSEPIPTFTLTVVSAHGSPVPSVGSHAIATNAALSNSVPSPVTQLGARYLCAGWTLDNHEPASGETNWMTMTLTNDATLTWLWDTHFLLTATADSGGSILPGGGWHAVGATVELEAVAAHLYAFASWTGDTNAIVSGSATSATISVRMDAPISLTAHFAATARTYYVSSSGTHVAPYTDWTTASTSLQAIVDYVPADSTVRVAAGFFGLANTLELDKALHLKSDAGPNDTLLYPQNSSRVLLLSHANAIVEGFSIFGGSSGSSGGGVRIEPAGRLVNCIIAYNSTDKNGGGVALIGGGELRNCLFFSNYATTERGGGLYTYTVGTAPLVENCTFSANAANEGGGVYLLGPATLRNSIVWGNNASTGTNLVRSGSGQTVSYTLSGPVQSGTGNRGDNPRFVEATNRNFRLLPNSPAINAGTNQSWMTHALDLDARPRVIYGTNDLGAYEGLLATVDSDEDGPGDWQEAQAGTDPFDPGSFLGIQSAGLDAVLPGQFVLRWSSATGRNYRITSGSNLTAGFPAIAYSNIPARPPANAFTGALAAPGPAFYRIELED